MRRPLSPDRPHRGHASDDPDFGVAEDALIDADQPFSSGTARSALRHRDFRIVWLGGLASNVGTWMQTVGLGAFAYALTKSPTYVALLGFAQLGPLLLLSTVGGLLADIIDRRRLMIAAQTMQLVFSFALAWSAAGHHPSKTVVFVWVLLVGIGNAMNAPAQSAILPVLVGREDLAGAISLQSAQVNVARVIGPAIGGAIYPLVHAAGLFGINAATYLFAIVSLLMVRLPPPDTNELPVPGQRSLLSGFRVARADPLIRRALITMALMSFFCLPITGLMPVLAAKNLSIDPSTLSYGVLYALFGAGAAVGAVAIGTVLAHRSKERLLRWEFGAFALSLSAFALVRRAAVAYPVAFILGLTYFAAATTLTTILQEHLDERIRGRIMALWIMAFGGTVPLGYLAAGPVATHASITVVLLIGGAAAAFLALYADLRGLAGRAIALTGAR